MTISPDQACRVCVEPPAGIRVNVVDILALGDAVGVFGEEEAALSLPVRVIDKAGNNAGAIGRRAILPVFEAKRVISANSSALNL